MPLRHQWFGAARGEDTFGDVFARVDPEFQSCFMAWTQVLPEEVVAIDPTTGRGASGPCIWSRLGHAEHPDFRSGQDGEVQ